jgi:hypothetical protein
MATVPSRVWTSESESLPGSSSGISRQQQQARAAAQTEANSAERTLPQPTDAHVVACMRPAADQGRVRAAPRQRVSRCRRPGHRGGRRRV